MEEIRCNSFDEYLAAVREQVRRHEMSDIRSKDSVDDLRVGFESPDGWWTVNVRAIRSHFSSGPLVQKEAGPKYRFFSRSPSNKEIASLMKKAMAEAVADGIRIRRGYTSCGTPESWTDN